MNAENVLVSSDYQPPADVKYFYGRILREDSDNILIRNGCSDGLYLLRESTIDTGSYVLSLCFNNSINHYKIARQEDGTVTIKNSKTDPGKKFIGPIELIEFYKIDSKNLITSLKTPCNRRNDFQPINYLFINDSQMYYLVNLEITKTLSKKRSGMTHELYKEELANAKGRYRYKYEKIVLKNLHLLQPWYKNEFDRDIATIRLYETELIDGKFLLRGNDTEGYKISLCHDKRILHYKIYTETIDDAVKYTIGKMEKKFDTIIQLVDYYHRCYDLNNVKLNYPYIERPLLENHLWLDAYNKRYSNIYTSNEMIKLLKNDSEYQIYSIDDEPNNTDYISDLNNIPTEKRSIFENEENYNYESLTSYTIDLNDLVTYDKLGSGCFGSVYRGTYKNNNNLEIPVAIKKMNIDTEESKKEITKEAELMKSLNNPHIVKFIGMCFDGGSLRIVLELAKLGPLHIYLRTHKESVSMPKIVKICYQVAMAMEYLSSKGLVHRDLAARNVLLVSEDISKVSDFGMSRKMDENKYYETHAQGKWPLKWYPPDAITHLKFDEKSDVWSFGVTCWEATSYGDRPYFGIDINLLLIKLQNGYRLDKPYSCPDEMYDLMYKCWNHKKTERPNFKEIVQEIFFILRDLYNILD